jgi:hypothetical protein
MKDIRSSSGKVDHLSHPHMAYLRISVLEMEKARRNKEKESALCRVRAIDERLREIETEKALIQQILSVKEGASPRRIESVESGNGPALAGFKIRY